MEHAPQAQFAERKQSLGRWVLAQMKRDDEIGELARCAHLDPRFPIDGDFKAISARLNALEAPPEMHIALEEAELDWAAL